MSLWNWSLKMIKDTKMKGRIVSAQHVISTSDYLFGYHSFNSSRSSTLKVKHVTTAIWKDRKYLSHNPFWQHVMKRKYELENIGDPILPRMRLHPYYFGSCGYGNDNYYSPSIPQNMYHRFYYKALECTVEGNDGRFNQTVYQAYSKTEHLLMK